MIVFAIGGAIIGIGMALANGDNIGVMAVVGAGLGIGLRKWILRTFWK